MRKEFIREVEVIGEGGGVGVGIVEGEGVATEALRAGEGGGNIGCYALVIIL